MALQGSGAISFLQMQSEFGGANPISMDEYYRGGSYVPTSVVSAAGAWSSYMADYSSHYFALDGYSNTIRITWGGVILASGLPGGILFFAAAGYDYEKGSVFGVLGGDKGGAPSYYSTIRRRTSANSVTVNTGISASGTISMNQLYGGRKT